MVALLAVTAGGCSGDAPDHPAAAGPLPPAVEVVTLESQPFREQADLLGELQAQDSVIVRSEVAGVVERVGFEEGQRVEAGTVLFQLRAGEQEARLREAEAQLSLAQEGFARTSKLASRNAAAAAQLDQARANLEIARARADRRRVELDRTRIRAPFTGRVGARLVSPGARIRPEDDLVRLDAMDPLVLAFTIPEVVLPLARVGSAFTLEVAAWPKRRFPGQIFFIAPNVDSATRRVLVKGRVPNPDGVLLPGMFARVQATLAERQALLVPEEALVADAGGTFVWRLDKDEKAERVRVELGAREPGRVEVRSGLSAGDRIVTAGTHKVRDGGRVRPMATAAGAAPPAPAAAPRGGA